MNNTNRIKTLESLRALAFTGVMLIHTGFAVFDCLGAISVSVFFIMSGFVLSINKNIKLEKASIANNIKFAKNKIKKLYILYVITTLLCAVFSLFGNGKENVEAIILKLVCNFLLIQEWLPIDNRTYNGPGWFLCTLLLFYFIYPFIAKRIEKASNKKATKTIILLYLLEIIISFAGNLFPTKEYMEGMTTIHYLSRWFVYFFPMTRVIDCIIGAIVGNIYIKDKKDNINQATTKELILVIALSLSFLIDELLSNTSYFGYFHFVVVNTPISTFAVYLFAKGEGRITNFLTNKTTMFLAKISPYGFLIHDVINKYINAGFVLLFGSTYGYNYNIKYGGYVKLFVGIPLTIVLCLIWIRISDSYKEKIFN